jgi:hypothetical protein
MMRSLKRGTALATLVRNLHDAGASNVSVPGTGAANGLSAVTRPHVRTTRSVAGSRVQRSADAVRLSPVRDAERVAAACEDGSIASSRESCTSRRPAQRFPSRRESHS